MNLFLELWKHEKLATKRHPMYEKSKFAKFFINLSIVFYIGYLLFFACLFAAGFSEESVEPYHIINSIMWVFLLIDVLLRIPFQKIPTQEMKPYLLLPIPRKKLIDMLLIRSGMSPFNFFWLAFYTPFAILTVSRFYGITGVLTYCIGMWLMMLINNYWYLLCRTLISQHKWWLALPVAVYIACIATLFIPQENPLSNFFLNLGEAFITGNLMAFMAVIALIILLCFIDHRVLKQTAYQEMNRVEDSTVQVKHVSEYRFLDRYGEVGEYIRLELKLLLRNKICRNQIFMALTVTCMFSFILGFTNTYSGLGKDFFTIYNFQLISVLFLSPLMCYEGNYIDGLMSRKESIYSLLQAKYILYSLAQLIPFVLMLPGIINGSISLKLCLGWLFFVPGPIYFVLFQMAVYNQNTIHLNIKMMSRKNVGSKMQNLISGLSFFIPFTIYALLNLLVGEEYTPWTLMLIGIGFILVSPLWLKNIYKRFMKRRHQNLEGFHNSREK